MTEMITMQNAVLFASSTLLMGWRYVYCPVCKWSAGEVGILVKAMEPYEETISQKRMPEILKRLPGRDVQAVKSGAQRTKED
jgi:hypothetical protein